MPVTPKHDTLDELLAHAEDILADPLNHRFEPIILLQILTQLAYEYRTHTHHLPTPGIRDPYITDPPTHPHNRHAEKS